MLPNRFWLNFLKLKKKNSTYPHLSDVLKTLAVPKFYFNTILAKNNKTRTEFY